jgi:arylsulfatase A-like enzyme
MLGSGARDALAAGGPEAKAAAGGFGGKNVVMFITDQERELMHFPKGWAEKNLPGLTQLKKNGMQFEHAFTNSCMCSPARATLLTGYMPAQHGVRHTLEPDMPADQYPQVELNTELKNIASVMSSAGYSVIYKGKFHLTKPPSGTYTPEDLSKYGFSRWNPKDAGADQSLPEGGGNAYENPAVPYTGGDNDDRFMNENGDVTIGQEGALAYINSVASQQQPFFMIISLVNPHDLLFYPKNFGASLYADSDLDGSIQIPTTADDSFATKPKAQGSIFRIFNLSGKLKNKLQQRRYLNFYGNLMKKSDGYLVDTLKALETQGLLDDTVVIRTSDHGEMGVTHGGMRQKSFVAYEEAIRVPLVYSNPKIFPKPRKSDALVSHVDFLPTIASLFGAPKSARADWNGVDYSKQLLSAKAKPVQDYVVFTYDDYQCGQKSGPYTKEPNHMTSIRESRWKLSRYYDPNLIEETEWEMYDLQRDPNERHNIAFPGFKRTPLQSRELARLKKKLAGVEVKRLAPIKGTEVVIDMTASATQTADSKTFRFTDTGTCTGVPTGNGNFTGDWVLNAAKGTGTGNIVMGSMAGMIKGVVKATFVVDSAANKITVTGTMSVIAGTGDFRRLKADSLDYTMTDNLEGTDCQVAIKGVAAYS